MKRDASKNTMPSNVFQTNSKKLCLFVRFRFSVEKFAGSNMLKRVDLLVGDLYDAFFQRFGAVLRAHEFYVEVMHDEWK